MSREGGGIQ